MTALLPHAVRDAIAQLGSARASASVAVVALVVLVVVLVEHEVMRAGSAARTRLAPLFVAAMSLSVAVVLTIAVRVADLLP